MFWLILSLRPIGLPPVLPAHLTALGNTVLVCAPDSLKTRVISSTDIWRCLQLGLAWIDDPQPPGNAIVFDEEEARIAKQLGWEIMTLNEALLEAQQDA